MGQAIGQVISFGVGVALRPLRIIAVVLMLSTPKGRVNGPAFLAGWIVGLAVVGIIVLLVSSGASASSKRVAAAGAVWRQAIDALADALAMYVSVLAPELIVAGGGLSKAGVQLLGPLDDALGKRLTFHRRPALRRATLGDQSGRLGAALLAWERARTAAVAA